MNSISLFSAPRKCEAPAGVELIKLGF